jgi:putative FmdB family regulatory protein
LALSSSECQRGYTAPVPIYEYRCANGHLTERFQRMSDPAVEVCDTCGEVVKKVLHPVSIHYKGSGFYNTDYGRGKGAKTDGSGGDGGSSGAADGGGSAAGAGSSSDGGAKGSGAGDAGGSSGSSGSTGTGGSTGSGSGSSGSSSSD